MKKIVDLYKKYEEIINYIIVGVATTVVSLGSYYLCVLTVFDPDNAILLQIANIISWVLAVTFAFWANRKYVFKSKNPKILDEATKFYGARVLTLLIDMGMMFLTVTVLHWDDKIMKILSQVVILILNYIISKFLVFIKKDN
ncbi:MAG: GtrA family protein [Bacilli bacterium]|nr:GtrA family protein [Bacilli bacterium]